MKTNPTVWTGSKTLSTNLVFNGAFWLFCTVVLLGLIAWRAGWFPAIKNAASKTFSQEHLEAMFR